jgi:tRNA U34 5-carboxymethylaminomethyl modifying GTPase MnmE/TrmE
MLGGRRHLSRFPCQWSRSCSVLKPREVVINALPELVEQDELLAKESTAFNLASLNKPKLLSVAIVGQPNVGKSTLFNKMTSRNRAIVTPIPGTTRDRRDGAGHLAGLDMNVIDTGGFDDRGAITTDIKDQIKRALMQADVVLYVVDGKNGINSVDLNFSQWLRKTLGMIEKYYPKSHAFKREVILVRLSVCLCLSQCLSSSGGE